MPKSKKYLLTGVVFLIFILIGLGYAFWQGSFSQPKLTLGDIQLSDRAESFSGMTDRDYLIFKNITADPFKVHEAEQQQFLLKVTDPVGVKKITAILPHDLGEDQKSMQLVEGNKKEGSWYVKWQTHDLSQEEYKMTFKAENLKGQVAETSFFWQYEKSKASKNKAGLLKKAWYLVFRNNIENAQAGNCSFTSNANNSMSSDCSISGVDGVDGGNLTVNSGKTLQINSGAHLIFNPGKQINVGGTIWVNKANSEIYKGYICVTDSDGDGCWVGSKRKSSSATCPAGQTRLKDTSYSPDCDDNDGSYCEVCCECTSGACCDGCHYYSSSHSCSTWTDYDYQCSGAGCGDNAQRKSRSATKYCSGSSSSCTGSTSYGSWSGWSTLDNCTATEKCSSDNSTYASCSYNAGCAQDCTPGSGPCCDSSGNFRPSSYVCDSTYSTDYGCPWGTSCGDNVGVRYKTRKCSGSSSSCNGTISSWGSYSTYDNCASTETCSNNDSTCNYTSSCDSIPVCEGCVTALPSEDTYFANIGENLTFYVRNPQGGVTYSFGGRGSCTCSNCTSCTKVAGSQVNGTTINYTGIGYANGGYLGSATVNVCDYGGYSSCSSAYNLTPSVNSSKTKQHMCSRHNQGNYYKVTVPSGYTCDLTWTVEDLPGNTYNYWNLYTKSSNGSCPSTSNYSCHDNVYGYSNGECSHNSLSAGTYYAYVNYTRDYSSQLDGETRPKTDYQITATLSNCSGGGSVSSWYPNDSSQSNCTLGGNGSCTQTYCNSCNSGTGAGQYISGSGTISCPSGKTAVTGKCVAKNDETCAASHISSNGKGWYCSFTGNYAWWCWWCKADGCGWVKCQ